MLVGLDLGPVSGPVIADRYEELVPAPDVVRLHGIGHFPQLEAPDAVLRAFEEHISRIGGTL